MKKIIYLLIIGFSLNINSQKWTFKSGGNVFDGKYKTSSVKGSGGKYPYSNPTLVINFFESSDEPNVYINGAGYSGCNNKRIFINFEGEKEIYTFNSSSDANNESWFINFTSFYPNELLLHELLEKFMQNKFVNIRLYSHCSEDDYKFSLFGSTQAIQFVVGESWIENRKKIDLIIKEKDKIEKERELKEKIKEKEKMTRYLDSVRNHLNSFKKQSIRKENEIKILSDQKKDSLLKIIEKKYENFNHEIMITVEKCNLYENTSDIKEKIKLPKNSIIAIDPSYQNKVYLKVIYIDSEGSVNLYIPKKVVERVN